MTPEQLDKLVDAITVTAEVMGTNLKPGAIVVMADDLAEYDFLTVMQALRRCRRETSGRLTLRAVLEFIDPDGGWLTADEAWSNALRAQDESNTVIWTDAASQAFHSVRPLVESGDLVAARMAFIPAYKRLVNNSRNRGHAPGLWLSPGTDARQREEVARTAAQNGLPVTTAGILPPAQPLSLPDKTRDRRRDLAAAISQLIRKMRVVIGINENKKAQK